VRRGVAEEGVMRTRVVVLGVLNTPSLAWRFFKQFW
jgi:hypothetical protein